MQEDNTEYPPGYLEACEKHKIDELGYDPPPDSVADIWIQLEDRRDYEKGYPKILERFSPDSPAYQEALKNGAEASEEFKARLDKAALDGDRVYIKNLLKVIGYDDWPEPEMNGIRAAIKAFGELFESPGYESKDDWPTKQEVRKRAEEILQAAGRAIPEYDRSWARIFKEAGLSGLPSAKFGPAHKRKKN
jgi:hypothetical protein